LDDEHRETTGLTMNRSHHDLKRFLVVRRKTGKLARRPALAKARAIKHHIRLGWRYA